MSNTRDETGLTEQVAAFAAGLRHVALPDDLVAIAADGFTDCLGVMIAGRDNAAVSIVEHALIPPEGPSEARIISSGRRVSAPHAALVNGVAAHALDYDDSAFGSHPSAVLVPAILAEAEALSRKGPAMLAAYIAGYESWAELASRETDQLHLKGWHPTSVLGVVASAIAASVLHQLDAQQTAHAIGIAASSSCGLMANFGSMTKALQVGRAAQIGVEAARLAAAGLTATAGILEQPNGFLHTYSPKGRVDTARAPRMGIDWHMRRHGLNIKLYPMCYGTHRYLDAMLDTVAAEAVAPSSIAAVDVWLNAATTRLLSQHRPTTATQARFSIEFAVAAASIARRCSLHELTDDFVNRPDVQAMIARVRIHPLDVPDDGSLSGPPARLAISLHDGRTIDAAPVAFARGHFKRAATRQQLREKFEDCASPHMGSQTGGLFDALQRLSEVGDANDLPLSSAGIVTAGSGQARMARIGIS